MSKTVTGIEIKGTEAIVVTLKGDRINHEQVGTSFKKIKLKESSDQSEILSFRDTLAELFKIENVGSVGIKARALKGEFIGGPLTFKIEGIIQTIDVPVLIIHPASLKATLRKDPFEVESHCANKYQFDAYIVAYHMLGD